MTHTTIRKVRIHGGTGGYRVTTVDAMDKGRERGYVFLADGVDGDEDANTVTYYYTRYTQAEAGDFIGWGNVA